MRWNLCKTTFLYLIAVMVLPVVFEQVAYSQCQVLFSDSPKNSISRIRPDGSDEAIILTRGSTSGLAYSQSDDAVFFAQGSSIYKINRTGSDLPVKVLEPTSGGEIESLALDATYLYWIAYTQVGRSKRDGSDPELLFQGDGVAVPPHIPSNLIAVPEIGKLYWVDALRLVRMNMDGTNLEVMGSIGFISSLAIDQNSGTLYFVTSGQGPKQIKRAALDGSNVEVFLNLPEWNQGEESIVPGALEYNQEEEKLYWVAHSSDDTGMLQRISTDGTEIEDVLFLASVPEAPTLEFDAENSVLANTGFALLELQDGPSQVIYQGFESPSQLLLDESDNEKIFFIAKTNEGSHIFQTQIDGTGTSIIYTTSGQLTELALDPVKPKIYWYNATDKKIQRANLDGTTVQDIVTGFQQMPPSLTTEVGGLAIDAVGRRLYWTEVVWEAPSTVNSRVRKSKLNGTSRKTIISSAGRFGDIAFESLQQKIYWNEAGMASSNLNGRIRRANKNGSAVEELYVVPPSYIQGPGPIFSLLQGSTLGIALEASIGKMYWIDNDPTDGISLKRANFDGSGVEIVRDDFAYSPADVALLGSSIDFCGQAEDYDGDKIGDYAVYRPESGNWFVKQSTMGSGPDTVLMRQWGLSEDVPLRGDSDGDGLLDLIVWRPGNGTFYNCYSSDGFNCALGEARQVLPGGVGVRLPLAADMDGDGADELIDFTEVIASGGRHFWYGNWRYFQSSSGQEQSHILGYRNTLTGESLGVTVGPNDVPVAGDIDGDQLADIGIWHEESGLWHVMRSSDQYSLEAGNYLERQWGLPGDHPFLIDFTGDGKAELVVWRPSTGVWYSCSSGEGDSCAQGNSAQFGLPNDIPVPFDRDGDGRFEHTVFRPLLGNIIGTWYVNLITAAEVTQFGLPGDIPIGSGTRSLREILYGK